MTSLPTRLMMIILAITFLWNGPILGQADTATAPRYVFLFIGDGMGFAQVELADQFAPEGLRMNRLPVQGQIHTHSANNAVTDSASAATALASGVKTNNGMLGMLPDGQPVETIAERFVKSGWKVGLLTSVQANHATPAAFFAHVEARTKHDEIAAQLPASGVHLLAGRSLNATSNDARANAYDAWQQAGITVATTFDEAAAVPHQTRLALIAPSVGQADGKPGELADAVKLAIDRFAGEDPFFIMVEGGAIDWAGHANHAWDNVREMQAFDRAITVALDFYEQYPDQTLIIVTADHETGGLTIDPDRLDKEAIRTMHQPRERMADAIGKDAETMTSESVLGAAAEVLGGDLSEEEQSALTKAVGSDIKRRRDTVLNQFQKIVQARAGVTWSTGGHTGQDVPLYAIGVGSERFSGPIDNTRIPLLIMEITGYALDQAADTE